MEFRDSQYLLSAKSGRKLRAGMVFNLVLGFTDLEHDGKKYVEKALTERPLLNAMTGTLCN